MNQYKRAITTPTIDRNLRPRKHQVRRIYERCPLPPARVLSETSPHPDHNTYPNVCLSQISLSPDLSCGSVAQRELKNDLLNNPTKMMRKGNAFYLVNTKFEDANQGLATTPYEIIRVDRDSGEYECPQNE